MLKSTSILQDIRNHIRKTQRQERTEGGEKGSFFEKERGLEEITELVQKYGDERAHEAINDLW